jgi:predicted site-specific integrase-resolvase
MMGNAQEGTRAAQYVRMSTDYQQYSTANQVDAIAAYAAQHDLTIVRTYKDDGRSGLRIDGRQGLKDLIADVVLGRADFDRILVFDVSRWGRFQDTDVDVGAAANGPGSANPTTADSRFSRPVKFPFVGRFEFKYRQNI